MQSSRERTLSDIEKQECILWEELDILIPELCRKIGDAALNKNAIVAVNRGGVVPGVGLSHWFKKPLIIIDPFCFDATVLPHSTIVVEDVVDTGKVCQEVYNKLIAAGKNFIFAALFRKPWSPKIGHYVRETDKWIKMPWEYNE